MQQYISILFFLITTFLVSAQVPAAQLAIDSSAASISGAQLNSIYEKVKGFPEQTELAIAIIENGEIRYVGIKRAENNIQLVENHQSVFEIGSISKVFTATLLAHLVKAEKLQLSDDIKQHLAYKVGTEKSIELTTLANHTSGLPRMPSNLNLFLADPKNPYKEYDAEKLKTYLSDHISLATEPGASYAYSNLGAGLLGYLLQEVSGMSYDSMLRQYIAKPLDMAHTTCNRADIENSLVSGRGADGQPTSNWDLSVLVGAGGILSNVVDLSTFAMAQFDKEHKALALTQKPTFIVNDNLKLGLGWHISINAERKEAIWHNGGTGGYKSCMALDVDQKNGIIILSNVSAFHAKSGNIDALCFGLLKSLYP